MSALFTMVVTYGAHERASSSVMQAGHATAKHVACASSGAASRSLCAPKLKRSTHPCMCFPLQQLTGIPPCVLVRCGHHTHSAMQARRTSNRRRSDPRAAGRAHHGEQRRCASAQRVANDAQPEGRVLGEGRLQRLHRLLQDPARRCQHPKVAARGRPPSEAHSTKGCSRRRQACCRWPGAAPVAQHDAVFVHHVMRLARPRQAREHVLQPNADARQARQWQGAGPLAARAALRGAATFSECVPRMASTMLSSLRSHTST